ncbi:aminotransferase class V-fold PLP-dependent enzyme [Massilia sp.]|uniref:aminotransferase class V-fold PLP-dependent enzyme n=1 Tax=Massilia sp. TaxID=1882437 RepID=UPI0028A23D1B|nr:aminotransferase class V-fold PLP-dependent enzyme [Massilia sp.]
MNPEIYLDANATSPVLPAAFRAAAAAMADGFGNPSSSHAAGLRARAMREEVRACARRVLGADEGRLMFNSGATEGIQTAVLSALCAVHEARARGEACGDLVLIGATEHKAVPESLAHWNRLLGTGLELRTLPVDAAGRHRLDVLRELAPRAVLVCTMAANNETGVVSDLDGIAAALQDSASPALWMVDCVQALGKLPLNLSASRIDYAPFSGHKLYAPKGIGMLYVRAGAPFTPLMCGGGQEEGQRSGTENMAGIAALGAVLRALEEGGTFRTHAALLACRARLAAALQDAFPGVVFNAPFEHALPTTINFSVPGVSSADVLEVFDAAGMRVSAGSACSAAKAAPSHVLDAMGVPGWQSASAVRMSFGPLVDDAVIELACARIAACARALALPLLAPMALSGERAGLVQLEHEGDTGWLLFDPASRSCIAIDVPVALAERGAAMLRAGGYRLLAALSTAPDGGADAATFALCAHAGAGIAGWPDSGIEARLEDGRRLPAIALGADALVRDGAAYLFGRLEDGVLAPRFAFGDLPEYGAAAALQCGRASERALASAHAPVQAEAMELDADALQRWLAEHPEALVVDVRCAREFSVGPVALHGQVALNVPLARLAEHATHWLGADTRPLLFVCRSGARSARAARTLRSLGHPRAWSLAGGFALAG